jgi:uncharacterized membrane protein
MKDFIRGSLFIIFVSSGIGHFFNSALYVKMVPPYIPFPNEVVLLSGAAILLMAIGIMIPKFSHITARFMMLFLLGTFPALFYMISNPEIFGAINPQALAALLPIQLAMFVGAWYNSKFHSPAYYFAIFTDPEFVHNIDENTEKEENEEKRLVKQVSLILKKLGPVFWTCFSLSSPIP